MEGAGKPLKMQIIDWPASTKFLPYTVKFLIVARL